MPGGTIAGMQGRMSLQRSLEKSSDPIVSDHFEKSSRDVDAGPKAVGELAFLLREGGKNRFQAAADSDRSDAERQPRALVSLDQNGAERRLARSRLEPPQGNAGREPAEGLLPSHADDGIVV